MSIAYSYGTLSAALQAWADNTAADFQTNMGDIMQKGELRLYHMLDLDNLDPTVAGGAISTSTGIVSKPTNMIRDRTVMVIVSGAKVAVLNKRTFEFVVQYLIDAAGGTGVPKYYAENDAGDWITAPLTALTATISVRGIFNPTLLGDNVGSTNLAGIVASAHLVGATALTLTTSPFVYTTAGLAPSQVWLYSAANLSANSFTIVGLDIDGNAQTEVLAGPDAGSVTSLGTYSSITSITPTTTDSTNYVSAGWSQDNSTWLSTRFGDLLFWCCMSEACQFNKRWTAAKVADAMIDSLIPYAQMITRSLKRNDLDSLYSGRQNVGAPGAVPLPVPPQTAQAQGQ
jgi:hypothetical protein